jgi:hypothetical protein
VRKVAQQILNSCDRDALKNVIEIVEGSPKNQRSDQRPARYRLKLPGPSIQKAVWPSEVVLR